jgi:DNA gyrase subunit A
MEIGLVQRIDIDQEMQQAYLDYAMSVIVARALPDARDGLKPVHRRILYAMYDMGLRSDTSYKKSARIVGEVLGKYHPHGDAAVYEAMARMAQDFSMRIQLVDGQGNFGSVDGDPPAAMRYTEARLAAPAQNMLVDINKDTVNFTPNFDDTLKEPDVLPSAIPNLLVNGATGIAVGMSTSIPPHNLSEVVDALRYLLENWDKMDDIGLEELMGFIKGPDFPTGGVIIHGTGEASLAAAYGSGRGQLTVQARAHLEDMERGRSRIIVTELPYMTNKSSLIERIAELARENRLEGIVDLRDESDRQGMRIVIELSKTADPEMVLGDLYKHTPMQSTFSIIMLALVDGEPRMLSLKQALRVYLDHRLEIIRRRSEYDLEKARQRAHILDGLRVALKNLDEVIDIIRKAPDVDAARTRLIKRFKLSEVQAQAILDMQLRRLAALERKKIEEEYKELQAFIKDLEGLLRSPAKMRQMAGDELLAMKEAFGDRRRTHIVSLKEGEHKKSLLTIQDIAPEKTSWLSVTADGLISRGLDDKLPRQSGSEAPVIMLQVNSRDTLYLASESGETAAVAAHAIPEVEKPADGTSFHKLCALRSENKLVACFTLPPKNERAEEGYVLSATRQGMVKKSPLSDLPGPSATTFTLVRVNEGDRLGWLRLTNGQGEILMLTSAGMAIRFGEDEVRPMGMVAAGVMGIKLTNGDEVVGLEVLPQPGEVFMVASDGSAKRVAVDQFPKQGRYGQGVQGWKLPAKTSVVGFTLGKGTQRVTLFLNKLAPKMVRLDEAPLQGRAARGKNIQELKAGDQVVSLVAPWELERLLAVAAKAAAKTRAQKGTASAGSGKPAPKASATAKGVSLKATGSKSAAAKAATRKTAAAGKTTATTPKPAAKPTPAPKVSDAKASPKTTTATKAKTPAASPKGGVSKTTISKSAPAKPAPAKSGSGMSKAAKTSTVPTTGSKAGKSGGAAALPGQSQLELPLAPESPAKPAGKPATGKKPAPK